MTNYATLCRKLSLAKFVERRASPVNGCVGTDAFVRPSRAQLGRFSAAES
jgi:hypothetical protein